MTNLTRNSYSADVIRFSYTVQINSVLQACFVVLNAHYISGSFFNYVFTFRDLDCQL